MPPQLLDFQNFQRGCRSYTAKQPVTGMSTKELFAEKLISKATVLVRNPFGAIIDRMQVGITSRMKENATYWTQDDRINQFNQTKEGVLAWCQYLDSIFDAGGEGDFDELMRRRGIKEELYRNLPCKTEWFRYVQFYNFVLRMTGEEAYNVPMHVTNVEDYATKDKRQFERYVSQLLSFIEQSQVDRFELPGAKSLRSYASLFDGDAARAATKFVKAIAIELCWDLVLKRYLNEWVADTTITNEHDVASE